MDISILNFMLIDVVCFELQPWNRAKCRRELNPVGKSSFTTCRPRSGRHTGR